MDAIATTAQLRALLLGCLVTSLLVVFALLGRCARGVGGGERQLVSLLGGGTLRAGLAFLHEYGEGDARLLDTIARGAPLARRNEPRSRLVGSPSRSTSSSTP